MSDRATFRLAHAEARRRAMAAVANAPEGYVVTVAEPTRTLDQNAALWPLLDAFSKQAKWPVNGVMTKLTPEEWKDLFTAALAGSAPRVAMGINGGMVLLGERTSTMGKRRFSDLLELIHAEAVTRGVDVSTRDVRKFEEESA